MPTPSPIRVTFWGAAHTVTGSMHLIETGRQKILLDCGLFQGRRAEAFERNKTFPFPASDIDTVVLSHAHIDHCGNLPNLVRRGFKGPIFCTPATRDLIAVMLADSAKIQEEDASHLSRHRRPAEPEIEPLYDQRDVRRTLQLARAIPYDTDHDIGGNIMVRFVDAGHLLGSAMVHVAFGNGRTITFTGDLGRKDMPILRDPQPIPPADLLISESTYGGRNHPGVEMLASDLAEVVTRTIQRGGKVLIPAFSLGRTQTIVFFLHQLIASGQLPRLPIFVDSPLAAAATEVFRLHPECFDEETSLLLYKDRDLFGEKVVHYTRSVEESKAINESREPCVVIAASGMCESGRILHHLKHNIGDPRNTVLIIGFQAPQTLGRRLVERKPEVRIFGVPVALNAEVVVLNGFSGHAGRDDLLAALTPLVDAKRKVRLVHGDPDQAEALLATLKERGFTDVAYPDRGESVTLE
ncbi:MAG: MBL fold metallo-hydrolase [Gemmataceae bacterium]|nr:MBL fold metallo-hydrolase [Gemmataceae bacterium]